MKNISGVKDGYDIRNFEKEQLGGGVSCLIAGKYKDLLEKGDVQAEVDRILNARHMFGQEEWKLHRKAFQTFNKYMEELALVHSGVDPNSPDTFFIDTNVVKQRAKLCVKHQLRLKTIFIYIHLDIKFPLSWFQVMELILIIIKHPLSRNF